MATDFWGQFQPYEDGGVTGRTYDPSQLQVQQPGISVNTPSPSSPMNGGGFYNPSAPKLDPNTGQYYTPNPPQVQPAGTPQPQEPIGQMPPPGYGTLNQLGQIYHQMQSGGGGGLMGSALGGMFGGGGGSVGGLLGGAGRAIGGMFGFGGGSHPSGRASLTSGRIVRIRTPSGREMALPSDHLQEALSRGATQIG